VDFFLKWKGHFSFWCSALQVFGQCGGAKCGLGFAKTIFWGKGFGKTETDSFLKFGGVSDLDSARRKGSGE